MRGHQLLISCTDAPNQYWLFRWSISVCCSLVRNGMHASQASPTSAFVACGGHHVLLLLRPRLLAVLVIYSLGLARSPQSEDALQEPFGCFPPQSEVHRCCISICTMLNVIHSGKQSINAFLLCQATMFSVNDGSGMLEHTHLVCSSLCSAHHAFRRPILACVLLYCSVSLHCRIGWLPNLALRRTRCYVFMPQSYVANSWPATQVRA